MILQCRKNANGMTNMPGMAPTALLDDRGDSDRAQCMACHFIMCNSNLKPARLNEHQVKHSAAEHEQAFQVNRARYDQRGTLPQLGFKPMQKPLLRASYEVAYQCIQVKVVWGNETSITSDSKIIGIVFQQHV